MNSKPLPLVDSLPAMQALLPDELAALAGGIEIGDARKLLALVHRGETLPLRSPAEVRRKSLDRVRAVTTVPALSLVVRTPSAIDPFVKYAVRTPTGAVVEMVKIPLEQPGRVSVCVSSQVGCAMACSFCATGRLGLVRNLEAWEIVEQVRMVRRDLGVGERIHGVVFQGMGEPLANFAEVKRAARVLSEPCTQAIDARNITISTSGLPTPIRALASELPKLRLALSIGSARSAVRKKLIPLEERYPLTQVLTAVGEHAERTGLAPLFAYTLLEGVNDTREDALALSEVVKDFALRYGRRPRVSLIPYNSIGENDPYRRTSEEGEALFRESVVEGGVFPTRRYSGGSDVAAACGQLAAKAPSETATLS